MSFERQRRVAGFLEFGVGVPLNVLLGVALYYWLLPTPDGMETGTARLVFALQCSALPVLTMLAGVWVVALGRATSAALDPLAGAESPTLQVHMRYLSNTTEQVLLFIGSAAALATFLGPETILLIPTLAILFAVNRVLYWIGYLIDPAYRGLGLSGTIYPVSFMVVMAAYYALGRIVGA